MISRLSLLLVLLHGFSWQSYIKMFLSFFNGVTEVLGKYHFYMKRPLNEKIEETYKNELLEPMRIKCSGQNYFYVDF